MRWHRTSILAVVCAVVSLCGILVGIGCIIAFRCAILEQSRDRQLRGIGTLALVTGGVFAVLSLSYRDKRHLRYPSVEAWFKGEGLTDVFTIADPAERDRRITEYGELRHHLFAKHVRTLSRGERRQFKEGSHPSQSHRFADRAAPFVELLREHLASLGFPARVFLGFYHLDRIVLSAELDADPGERQSQLPWVYRGFEIKYMWPQGGAGESE